MYSTVIMDVILNRKKLIITSPENLSLDFVDIKKIPFARTNNQILQIIRANNFSDYFNYCDNIISYNLLNSYSLNMLGATK